MINANYYQCSPTFNLWLFATFMDLQKHIDKQNKKVISLFFFQIYFITFLNRK